VAPPDTVVGTGTGANAGYPVRSPKVNEFITNEDPHLESLYRTIRDATDDVPKIADELDWHDFDDAKLAEIEEVVDVAKRNMFVNKHQVAIGPGDLRHGNFSPLPGVGELWKKAMDGRSLDRFERSHLRSLIAHEYVEAKLLELGIPYKLADPKMWDADGVYRAGSRPGPHELAPASGVGGEADLLSTWDQYGLTAPVARPFKSGEISKADLDAIVQAIKEQKGW